MMVIVDGIHVKVEGRLERIIRWLLLKRARIEELERVRITFNCAGTTISTEMNEAEKA